MELTLDLINARVSLTGQQRNQIREILREQFSNIIKEEREACHSIAYDEAMEWGSDLNGRTAGISIAGKIRARSS